ncbi:MAG TPA: hypothetical protein VFW92_08245, partial [Candidatus Limnocylindrales bacterium]|nr:hypothetical protein [Candidatus Limnocylindrales bacterium]
PVADLAGPDVVILACGLLVAGVGLRSVFGPAPLRPVSAERTPMSGAMDPIAATAMPLSRPGPPEAPGTPEGLDGGATDG